MTVYDIDVVREIIREAGIAPAELAERLGISQRTLREHIKRANESLTGIARIAYARSRGGYVMTVTDEAGLSAWMERHHAILKDDPATSADSRATRLLNDLLLRSDWITLDELAEMFFVSRSCVSSDLKRIEGTLSRFGLAVERRPHRGIRVTGSEMGRRLCLADATVRRLTAQEQAGKLLDSTFTEMLHDVSLCVDEVLERDELSVNSLSYQNLLVHIAIAVLRIKSGNYMPAESIPVAPCDERVTKAAQRISEAVSHTFEVELPPSEIAYIAIHLAGKQVLYEGSSEDDNAIVTDEAWDIVGRMLEVVWKAYRFDFRDDMELRMNLARHIVPLSVRLTYHMNLVNPLLDDIKERYPLAFAMASEASTVLADAYRYYPSEHEIGYIALSFELALEHQKTEATRSRVLVVCASGMASAHLLAYKIQEEFGSHLAQVTTCNAAQVAEQDFSNIDFVFTTVPLSVHVPVPVREITLMFTEQDRDLMERVLSGKAPERFEQYAPRGLFFSHQRFNDREDAIGFLCARARAWCPDQIPENFEDLVWERERLAPTSFGGAVAIPHPVESQTTDTFIAVAVLDEAIRWGTTTVQVVILICASRLPDAKLDDFYRPFASFLNDEAAVRRLIDTQDYARFIQELNGRCP